MAEGSLPEELLASADADEGPVFDKPWQARAFGLVVALEKDGGLFEWSEFQARLIEEVQASDATVATEDAIEAAYYEQWIAAFEQLLTASGVLTPEEIASRAAEFASEERTAEEFVEGDRSH